GPRCCPAHRRPAPGPGRAARAARRLAGRPFRPHRLLRVPVLLRGSRSGAGPEERGFRPRTGGHPARRALAPSGGRLPAIRRRRAPGARGLPRTGPPRPSCRARLPRRGLHPHGRDAGIGGPGDGPGVSGRLGAIAAAGVVVPAHNEEALLPACLAALRRTASVLRVPVHLLVVADSCSDRTAAVARAGNAKVISLQARRVGAARAAGMRELLRLTSGLDPSAVWLATTDADTVVPPEWLPRQLEYANAGWDVVLG